ncbi:heme ABC exporter ATP-binding protein CcmA [Hydrocarboniphaga sp.]|uniref:heme ABC exporter ATP-binding protein CcmA n=1 Tax=Hydrocarboniphaga sp. TaxID=2033016 RepID=UPI00262CAB5E|nr:heme ABC exporter ATP-binding protein CcmA [Hydrocarboniphaga sp.]
MSDLLLRTESLSVGRGDRVLLRELTIAVGCGQLVHLRGRNGTGKTSLLEVLAGLRSPVSGKVERTAGGLHWLGHKNALNGDLSVLENLQFWCALQHCDASAIAGALERLGLAKLRHRPCRTLSAGQKRRAALVRLLIAPRPLWLLDEPLAALDAEGLAYVGQMLDEHLQRDGGALVTSHQALPVGRDRLQLLEIG